VKFLIDAQLPKSLSSLLCELGNDSIHTLDLPDKNFSKDNIIIDIANRENRIVITKDSDFLESYLLSTRPGKLIIVKTGNIRNNELLEIFNKHISRIEEMLSNGNLVELNRDEIILHS
jgi:predicted nuclease of predicted toxin-antitoxin system